MNAEDQAIYNLLIDEVEKNCKGSMPLILYNHAESEIQELPESQIQTPYNEHRLIFNRRFNYFPKFIVLCKNPSQEEDFDPLDIQQQVASVVKVINRYNEKLNSEKPDSSTRMPLRLAVCSGGHDHEGESSGDGVIQINFSQLQQIKHSKNDKDGNYFVEVQPGVDFEKLLTELDKQEVRLGIPHGTCATVHGPGYVMGGGWGPWTRVYGMACEYLMEVDLVLGDGSTITARDRGGKRERGYPEEDLLWALRGGGSLSYGITTRLKLKAFKLPEKEGNFTLNWNPKGVGNTETYEILKAWENVIKGDNPCLIGTNLQIMAKPGDPPGQITSAVHECSMYGYFKGNEAEALEAIKIWFKDVPWEGMKDEGNGIDWKDRLDSPNNVKLLDFSNWDLVRNTSSDNTKKVKEKAMFGDIIPERPHVAPHKITSRLTGLNWNDEGRKNLLRSLCSPLLSSEGRESGVNSYVTLGAISGPYYAQSSCGEDKIGVAMPYRDRLYTIQYQVWWNEKGIAEIYANRAMDWIKECRERDFPQTDGSFISFKDAEVPIEQYFGKNYEQLKKIKEDHSKDPHNLFSSGTTIT